MQQKSVGSSGSAVLARGLIFTLALTLTLTLHAQSVLLKGDRVPSIGEHGYWFWDTLNHRIWYYEAMDGKWTSAGWQDYTDKPVYNVRTFLGYVWVEDSTGHGWSMENDRRVIHVEYDHAIFIGDSMMVYWNEGKYLGIFVGDDYLGCHKMPMVIDTVECMPTVCVPEYSHKLSGYCLDLHTWGQLDYNGHWRIAPKYDKPFHFQNGIAEVVYYGKKLKIDENGEVVPSDIAESTDQQGR